MIALLLALQVSTVQPAPTRPTAGMPIMEAVETCRNLFDERTLRATGVEPQKFSYVGKGRRYWITPSPVPGAVYAIPVGSPGEGTSEVRAACFGL